MTKGVHPAWMLVEGELNMATLKFELKALDGGFVDFRDMSSFVSRLSDCLFRVHKAIDTQDDSPRFLVHLAEIASFTSGIIASGHSGLCLDRFVRTVESLRQRADLPLRLKSADIRAMKKLADPLDFHTKSILLQDSIPIDDIFVAGCDWALSRVSKSIGTMTGRLDGLNIHAAKFFRIYPVRATSGAECYYPDSLHSKVVSLIGKRVRVEGTIHKDPDSVGVDHVSEVTSLVEIPEDNELPNLMELIGLFKHSPVSIGADWE